MLHTMNTWIEDMQVRRPFIEAVDYVLSSQCINMRSEGALSALVAHGFNIRLNICVATQICGVEVYASTTSHSTE